MSAMLEQVGANGLVMASTCCRHRLWLLWQQRQQAGAGCAVRGRDVANLPSMVKDYVVKRVVMWELGTRDKDEEERRQVKSGRCDDRTEQD